MTTATDSLAELAGRDLSIEGPRFYMGGSDAATAANMNPYKSRYSLIMEKRGAWQPEDISDLPAVRFGNELEGFIADEFALRTELKVRRHSAAIIHPEHDWMVAHIDRRIVGRNEGLEIKNRGGRMAQHYGAGDDGEPRIYPPDMLQCQHYMACTGWQRWHLAVYFGGADFRTYEIERDDELIDGLIEIESQCWSQITSADPVQPEWSAPTVGKDILRTCPGTNGEILTLSEEALHWHEVAVMAGEKAKQYSAAREAALNHLRWEMGEAAGAMIPGVDGGYTRKLRKRKAFSVEASESMVMTYTQKDIG